jgi:hypothetical protein
VCRHRKSLPCGSMIAGHTSWTHPPHMQRMFDCSLYQRNRARNRKDHVPRGIAMALTFGTLLSSQGADAHLSDPFRSLWGNPRYFTRSASLGQTGTARAPAWSSGRGGRVARAWGTFDRLHDVRGSVRRTVTTLAPRPSASKPVPMPRRRRILGARAATPQRIQPSVRRTERCFLPTATTAPRSAARSTS